MEIRRIYSCLFEFLTEAKCKEVMQNAEHSDTAEELKNQA